MSYAPVLTHRRRTQLITQRPFLRAFTLVEILVVIGIITVLIGILLPAMSRMRRSAEQSRSKMDLNTVSMALENYRLTFNGYPTVPWINPLKDATQWSNWVIDGSTVLYQTLCQPLQIRQGGISYGPFIDPEKFVTKDSNSVAGVLCDRNLQRILYFPAGQPSYATGNSYCTKVAFSLANTTLPPTTFYNWASDSTGLLPTKASGFPNNDMQLILGDANQNGMIDAGENPVASIPFLLWSAGPDKKFGFAGLTYTQGVTTDDVTNFDMIPAMHR